jgi:hypothetical protein
MSLTNHAKLELENIGAFSEEKDFYGGMTGKAVMELIEVFAKQNHSGMSASIVADIFHKLAKHQVISPLTGEDDEWCKLEYGDNIKYQNNRNSAVFKQENGDVTYNDSIIKRCPNGTTWTGPLYLTREDAIDNINMIRVKVKSFPFTPKTFYVDVLEEEIKQDDWIMWMKDPKQLDKILEYYDLIKE